MNHQRYYPVGEPPRISLRGPRTCYILKEHARSRYLNAGVGHNTSMSSIDGLRKIGVELVNMMLSRIYVFGGHVN